jgi:hypothetical protein
LTARNASRRKNDCNQRAIQKPGEKPGSAVELPQIRQASTAQLLKFDLAAEASNLPSRGFPAAGAK